MKIEMTMNCGWEEMFEKLMPPKKVEGMMVDVIGRIVARGDSMPRHDSPDPEEREYAEWVAEMRHGRQWAQRMDERVRGAAQQGVLLHLLLSDDAPIDSGLNPEFVACVPQVNSESDAEIDSGSDCYEPDWENMEEGLWGEIVWNRYCDLMMRTGARGGRQPDPASEDEEEREDALWLAQIEVDEANLELARCAAVKKEVDLRQSLPLSQIMRDTPWDRALKARPFIR